jgi:hypothetical protein
VQRKKTYGSNARYRYTYVRDATREDFERESKVNGEPPALPVPIAALKPPVPVEPRPLSITLDCGDGEPVTVSPKQARRVYAQLRELFGA